MTAIPTTTELGPDQVRLRDLMRRLAEAESDDAPILSVYLDVRPQAHGQRPAERPQLIEPRHRLRDIEGQFDVHTPAARSFAADRSRIEQLVEGEDLDGLNSVAIFACERIGLWEVVPSASPFETAVHAGHAADLFQLARLLDDVESAVVAVVDTNTCRLFVTRRGRLVELGGPDEPVDEHRRHDQGGWSQARYQRHVDMQDKRFAREAADAIDRLVQAEKAQHVVLAGDERIIPILESQLSDRVRVLVDHVTHMQMRSSADDVAAQIKPILAALEAAGDQELADRAIGEMRAGRLGVAGIDRTLAALRRGQVDEVVIDEEVPMDGEVRVDLVRQASLTDSHVAIVRGHPGLAAHEGVAATLRFRTR